MASIDKHEKGFNWRDTQIAFGRAIGLTLPEIGKAVQTEEHPSGVTDRTVSNRIADNKKVIEQQIQWFSQQIREYKLTQKEEVTAKLLKGRLEKLLGPAVQGLELALSSGDVNAVMKAATFVIEQVGGKATQTNLNVNTGEAVVRHIHEAPPQLMRAMDRMIGAGTIPVLLPGEAIEAEVIPDAAD